MRKKSVIAAIAVLVILLIAGSSIAYFNAKDAKDNVFTVGDVDIELTEPSWVPDEYQRALTANLSPLFTTSPAVADSVKEIEKTLYAIWLYKYKLNYNANGGENARRISRHTTRSLRRRAS